MQANLQGPENLMHCDNCINWEGDLVRPGCGVETLLDVIGRDWTLLDLMFSCTAAQNGSQSDKA